MVWWVGGVGMLGCSDPKPCLPIDEEEAPEGNTVHISFPDYPFASGTWRIDLEGGGLDVQCEVELGQSGAPEACSEDGVQVTSDAETIHSVYLEGYAPRNVTVSLTRDGTLEATQEFSPTYDEMGHCSTAVHAVVEFTAR